MYIQNRLTNKTKKNFLDQNNIVLDNFFLLKAVISQAR